MQETSVYIRMGVALLIISSVLITLFCLLGIAGAATQDYYEEQVTTINDVSAELSDLFNAHIPVVQICKQIENSDYNLKLQQVVVHQPARNNGAITDIKQYVYTSAAACSSEWDGKIGYLEKIDHTPADTYIIYMRVGG